MQIKTLVFSGLLAVTALASFPLMAADSGNFYGPQQSTLSQQQQNSSPSSYDQYQPSFNFGQSEEDKKPITNQYDDIYKKKFEDAKKEKPLLPKGRFAMYFVRTPGAKPSEVTLRLSADVSVSGCLKMTMPTVIRRDNGSILSFKLTDNKVEIDRSVRYAHFQCDVSSHFASADIVLDRDELMNNEVKQLSFQSAASITDYYNVDVDESHIALTAKTARAFKPFTGLGDKADPLFYWFYPNNPLVLYVPSAPRSLDLTKEVEALAAQKGLTGMQSAMKDFTSPSQNPNIFYFVDDDGRYTASLKEGESNLLGTVSAPETLYGAGGPYQKAKEYAVYARPPGTLE